VTADVKYARFEVEAKKHPKISSKLSKTTEMFFFLWDNFKANVSIMADRIQISAPAKHMKEVKHTIETLI
jgi:hypothetical protein